MVTCPLPTPPLTVHGSWPMQSVPFVWITNGGLLAPVESPRALAVAVNPVPVYALWRLGKVARPFENVVDVVPVKLPVQPVPQGAKEPETLSVAVPVFRL